MWLKNKMLSNKSRTEIIQLYLLFAISLVIIYKLPNIIGTVFQLLLLIAFWRSKRDYFWLAFVFIIVNSPGSIFSSSDPLHSFYLFNSSIFGNLYFWIPFLFLALYKAKKIEINYPYYFLNKILFIIGFYFLFLLAVNGIYKWSAIVRLTLPWFFLFLLPKLLVSYEDYAKFFNLLFSFVPFVLITQLYKLTTATDFAVLLGGIGNPAVNASHDVFESGTALRPVAGIYIPFLSLLGTTFFLTIKKNKYFSNNYLLVITLLSVLSIFLTATRSWLISAVIIVIFYSFVNFNSSIRSSIRYALVAIIVIITVSTIPEFSRQSELALNRYETINYIIEGDVTAGGTLKRFDVRGPKVMAHFYERPILGWGFGEEGASYSDGHVGHQNLLMHGGILGYLLFVFLWLLFIQKMIKSKKLLKRENPNFNIPLILISFFIGIHIINISVQWFGFLTSFSSGFTIAFLFSLGNMVYWESYHIEDDNNLTNSELI